ncbi:tetratricopeptide repeat protein [Promicromonospora sp. Marseille-Q5078]
MPDERVTARNCVDLVNAELTAETDPQFELVGWDIVRGTAQRPQEAINELIDGSDFLICIFKKNWGSNPGGPVGFTSGTEEELFTALLGLGRDAHPMRDVWLAFIDADDPSSEVEELKRQVQVKNALFYESVSDLRDFRTKLIERLRGWAARTRKEPRSIDLVPRSGRDILGADRLRRRGEMLFEYGHAELGAEAMQEAVRKGGPPEKIAYGRILARQGRIKDARELAQSAVIELTTSAVDLNTPSIAEAYAFEAYLLHREKKYFEAKQRRAQALELLYRDDDYTRRVRCRILDDLGLSHQKLNELDEANERFLEALEIRTSVGDRQGVAQSHVNLARNDVARGEMQSAAEHARTALEQIRPLPPSALHANVYLLQAQMSIREDDAQSSIGWARKSAALNAQFGNDYGSAMAENLLSQALARGGFDEESKAHARKSLAMNEEMGVADPPEVLTVLSARDK